MSSGPVRGLRSRGVDVGEAAGMEAVSNRILLRRMLSNVQQQQGAAAGARGGMDDVDVPVRMSARTKQSFKSLDRSLKAFLRSSNLPGMEYRLRLAGYNSLSDLLDADVETLAAHGFTPLMANRLLGALEEYLLRQLDKHEGVRIPFQLVRKGQKVKMDPTEKMKALPTFGKQNVKRQRYPEPPKMGRKRSGGGSGGKGLRGVIGVGVGGGGGGGSSIVKGLRGVGVGGVSVSKRPVSFVRLMSEENLPTEPIFRNEIPRRVEEERERETMSDEDTTFVVGAGDEWAEPSTPPQDAPAPSSSSTATTNTTTEVFDTVGPLPAASSGGGSSSSNSQVVRSKFRRSVPVFQEFFMPDAVDAGEVWAGPDKAGATTERRRCNSVPADYHYYYHDDGHRGDGTVSPPAPWCMLVRSYSCPSSLSVPPSQIEHALAKLCTSQELSVVEEVLRGLCLSARDSEEVQGEVRGKGGMEVLVDLLVSLCTHPRVVSLCLKLIKYLTREDVLEGVVPVEAVSAILQAMECHPTAEKTLSQGCLALGNIGRAVPSLSGELLGDRVLFTLGEVMSRFPASPTLQTSVISALAVGLGCCPQARLRLLSQHGSLLDLVLSAMETFSDGDQLQAYGCSFLALLMAEVAVEMESGVVQLMVERVCTAMATCGRDPAVAVWAAKALANAAENAALSDGKLAGRCCDLLAESLSAFPGNAQVWTWSLYALLQLVSRNRAVKEELVRGGVVSLLKTPPHDVPDFGVQYLENLLTLLVL